MLSRIGVWQALLAPVWCLAMHGPAFGASFDCGHAASARERFVCGDKFLSDLDEQLGQTYQARKALLSPHGAALLQNSERSWLHYIGIVCPLTALRNTEDRQTPAECLKAKYRDRLEQIASVGQQLGPFVFNRIDLFAAQPAADLYGSSPGFAIQNVSYPQIDSPVSAQADAWNRLVSRSLSTGGDDCGQGDEDTRYTLGIATARMIGLLWSDGVYCHGAAHGNFGNSAQNLVLLPMPRPLTAHDVFSADMDWAGPLKRMFWDKFVAEGWQPPAYEAARIKAELEQHVVQPENWVFSTDGLTIAFDEGEGGCYACNPPQVVIPWAALKPFLAPEAVVP